MSKLAWEILRVILNYVHSDMSRHYIATWTIAKDLGVDAGVFRTRLPKTAYDEALNELVANKLVEELPDLGQRFRLIVREQ